MCAHVSGKAENEYPHYRIHDNACVETSFFPLSFVTLSASPAFVSRFHLERASEREK